MRDSYSIYRELEEKNLLMDRPEYWWPNAGSFEVVIGTVLTQNTSWKNVEISLENLAGYLTLDTFLLLDEKELKRAIRSSGFYNQKAQRLLMLARNIRSEFVTFQAFQHRVTREWLLRQKGIGAESADSILCYACFREEMVVDSYTRRLLKQYGIIFESYEAYKAYLEKGIRKHCKDDIALHFARFHGMIVEYHKQRKRLLLQ